MAARLTHERTRAHSRCEPQVLSLETMKDFLEIYRKKSVLRQRGFRNAFYHALCNSQKKKYYSPELGVRQEMDLYSD